MADEKKPNEQVEVVTQEDLLKSLDTLQGKKPEEKKPAEKTVETVQLKKSADSVAAGGAGMKKALEVSDVLKEFADTIGLHVDASLTALQKSVNEGAQRDLAIVGVLTEFKKSLDTLAGEVAKLGKAPGAAAATAGTTTLKTDALKKSGEDVPDPAKVRGKVLHGLEKLVKSAKTGSVEQQRYIHATSMFESAGKIDDNMLAEALKA